MGSRRFISSGARRAELDPLVRHHTNGHIDHITSSISLESQEVSNFSLKREQKTNFL